MTIPEISLYLMRAIVYDNDFVNRWNPENSERLYEPFEEILYNAIEPAYCELGEDFFTEEFCDGFATGSYEDMTAYVKKYPVLVPLQEALDRYFNWLDNLGLA